MLVFAQWNLLTLDRFMGSNQLTVGKDYCWSWHNDSWAVKFYDPNVELIVALKLKETDESLYRQIP
jgi:hypothetical protein